MHLRDIILVAALSPRMACHASLLAARRPAHPWRPGNRRSAGTEENAYRLGACGEKPTNAPRSAGP